MRLVFVRDRMNSNLLSEFNKMGRLCYQLVYWEGRDFGYEAIAEQPDINIVALESEIYNYLYEVFRVQSVVNSCSIQAAQRVWSVTHRK